MIDTDGHADLLSTAEPRYMQLARTLAQEIRSHQRAVGTLLPTEAELQTLQAAVHALRRQLAGQTLRAYLTDVAARGGSDPAKDLAYRQLEETLAQFDQQTAAVTLVAEKLP